STGQLPEGTVFYDAITHHLSSGRQLHRSFFQDAVEQCAFGRAEVGARFVFILDEYETLFGRMRAAVRHDEAVRYTVVQPLLDQMVAFTRSNLLVFLGQQPN